MASISNTWEVDKDLPKTLRELLEETEINNSFNNQDVTDHLIDTMETSYAYLYRFQKDSIPYKRFHYQTREYLLNTTYNDIQSGLTKYREELAELEKKEHPDMSRVEELKNLIADLGEVRFGDFYLDRERRMCVDIPYDMIDVTIRGIFRRSALYAKDLTLQEIFTNEKFFYRFPIVILDNEVRNDIWITPFEKGVRITFYNTKATDLYNKYESQFFHDINVMFVKNLFYHALVLNGSMLNSFKRNPTNIPFTWGDFQNKLDVSMKDREGIIFCSLTFSSGKSSVLLECQKTASGISLEMDEKTKGMIASESSEMTVFLIYFDMLHRHNFFYPSYTSGGDVPARKVMIPGNDEYIESAESLIFIPLDKQNNPYKMPIPEDNFLIFKEVVDEDSSQYRPEYNIGIKMYYPNLYQIADSSMVGDQKYRVYYFYKEEPTIQYTALSDFYLYYLQLHYNYRYGIEELINMVYFKLPGYNKNFYLIDEEGHDPDSSPAVLEGDMLRDFYALFIKILQYRDYDYIYGTPDFLEYYVGDDVPLQYKIARMREFVRADHKTLTEYVKKEQDKTTLYHFFVNSVELRGRFRRSTRTEDSYNPIVFAISFEKADPGLVGSLKVVGNDDYNPKTEIHIKDVQISNPEIKVGEYVLPNKLVDRYVFTFRNENSSVPLPIKIYVDGLLTINYETIHVLGMDYIYIPTYIIKDDSYILVEREYSMIDPQITLATFPNNSTWLEFHYIETENLTYTMNDIFLRYQNGLLIDRNLYDIELIKNRINYDMEDERSGETNKFATMTDVRIRLSGVPFNGGALKVNVILNKISYIASAIAPKRGYPKFDLEKLPSNPDMQFARLYCNGRLVPSICYRLINSGGKNFIQSRIYCEIGDEFLFEFSPYTKEVICEIEEFDQNAIFDFSDLLDKAIDPEYYEIFVNGRRLGLPNVFEFGPHHGVFRGLKSKYLLAVYEKERDFEYFGYRQINLDPSESTYHYYFEPIDLINGSFMTDGERDKLIDGYIDSIKHPDAIIRPNTDEEDPIIYDMEDEVLEQLKIFYFEEVLPLTLGDPNKLQFLKEYLETTYPHTMDIFGMDIQGTRTVFLDPNKTVRVYNPKNKVACGESKTSCKKSTTCIHATFDASAEITAIDNMRDNLQRKIFDSIATNLGYEYVDIYKNTPTIVDASEQLLVELEKLKKYLLAFRLLSEKNDFKKTYACAVRCDRKVEIFNAALIEKGFQDVVLNGGTTPQNFFDTRVVRYQSTHASRPANGCANPEYPYVLQGEGVYDIIKTGDIDIPNSYVMLLGEEDYTNLLISEGKVEVPVDIYATEYTTEMYAIEKIYIEGL